MNHLVSIIIPVYNVEEYVDESISSAINQTYRNIEIIIVDDGSTDHSTEKCDYFGRIDNRVKVIHQKNMGLSDARNAGIRMATGEYIAFLDSDDFMNSKMIEILVNLILEFNADICCCDYTSSLFEERDGGTRAKVEVYSAHQARAMLLDSSGFKCYAWNKLYKRSLFNNICYPSGKCFEDITTTNKLFQKSSKIVYINKPLYFYRLRESSITRRKFTDKNYDLLDAINKIMKDSASLSRAERKNLERGYMQYYLTFLKDAIRCDKDVGKEMTCLRNIIKSRIAVIIFGHNISISTKLELLIFLFSPKVFSKLYMKRVMHK